MIYARIKISDTTNINTINFLIDSLEVTKDLNVDWSTDKRDIKLILTSKDQLDALEILLKSLFDDFGILQMDVSMDDEDPAKELNYRFTISPSSDSPEKQFLLKLFPAINLIN